MAVENDEQSLPVAENASIGVREQTENAEESRTAKQMNPTAWSNPPPPGTEQEGGRQQEQRAIDRIDPYLKSPEYIEYERRYARHRSRSRSYDRHRKRRSRSRSRHRRSRSRSRRRRRSGSRSRHRHSSHRRHKRSRSRSRSRSRHRHRYRRRSRTRSPPRSPDRPEEPDPKSEEEEDDDDEETEPVKENAFKNDGSFLEMFKKMQEEKQQEQKQEAEPQKPVPLFGKRRGGKVLKTGMVQKPKTQSEEELSAQDAWSVYMKEVRRYKEACCDDDSKTHPLVK